MSSELSTTPHEDAIFSLLPENNRAIEVVNHPENRHLAWRTERGDVALAIGPHIQTASCGTLATLGRDGTDIFVPGSAISRKQCSFELHPTTNVVMLYDSSNSQSTQFFGVDAVPFEARRLRRAVLWRNINTEFQMGSSTRSLVKFKIRWHIEPKQLLQQSTTNKKPRAAQRSENPRRARTKDDAETTAPSRWMTRPHTPGPGELLIRYTKINTIGFGSFGSVERVINLDTGGLLALKKISVLPDASEKQSVKREIETLARCKHEHIVEFIAFQHWHQPTVEIFMELKEGTLHSLIQAQNDDQTEQIRQIVQLVCKHMLMALDYLSSEGVVHRDVKPQNIFYMTASSSQPGYRFQLGDFGLCNNARVAVSTSGSEPFMAPEVSENNTLQTPKIDVWSLFVTIIWILDIQGYRKNNFRPPQENLDAILRAAETDEVCEIKEMARVRPDERASAAQMLLKLYDGDGLNTSKNQIQPLSDPTAMAVDTVSEMDCSTSSLALPTSARTVVFGIQSSQRERYRIIKNRNCKRRRKA